MRRRTPIRFYALGTRTILKVILIVGLLWFLLHTTFTVIDGLNDKLGLSDVGIVLGSKVELDGKPSKRLQSRLDQTVFLYKQGYFKHIIVSGGTGKEGFNEAKVMKDYLVKAGIKADAIIEDVNGVDTFMTAKNSKAIMDEHKFKSAMVITQYFHVTRTNLAMHKVGIDTVNSAHAEIFEPRDLYSLFREFFGYYWYVLLK